MSASAQNFGLPKYDRIAIVLNGNAKSVNAAVIQRVEKNLSNGEVFTSHHLDEAPVIARKIIAGGFGIVLTGGGDGTFTITATEVCRAADEANVLAPRFGLLKLGTGNALACVAGTSTLGDPKPAPDADQIGGDVARLKIRLVKVDGVHAPFAGLGADAQILADYNATRASLSGTPLGFAGRGLLGYGVAATTRSLPKLLFAKMPTVRVTNLGGDAWPVDPSGAHQERAIPKGGIIYEGPSFMTAFSTIPYYGFGMKLFPFADPASSRMQLRISRVGSPQFVTNFRKVWNGTYYNPKYLTDFLVEHFKVECEEPIDFQIGGDSQGKRVCVEAQTTTRALKVIDFNRL